MKHTLLTLWLLLLPLCATAQHFSLRLNGGLASRLTGCDPVGAFKIGASYEYEFGQHFTVSPALLFSARGWKDGDRRVRVNEDDGTPAFDEEGNPLYSVMGRSTAANYIELPVLFNYYHRLAEARYLQFSFGPYAAIGVAGKVKTRGDGGRAGSEKLYYEDKTFGSGGYRRFDAGLQAAAGYQFPTGLTLGVEADLGLTRVRSGGGRNVGGYVWLSYRFD